MADAAQNKENGVDSQDHSRQRQPYNYGGNPLAQVETNESARAQAFGGALQPGLYKFDRKKANPAPLGLSAFALTTFLLSLINLGAKNSSIPNIVVASAFGYGGLVQLLAGMWEMALGNTFGATALSSYGGFWISFGITFTPGGFQIESAYDENRVPASATPQFAYVFAFYLMGWFIFTFLMLLCTLKSTVAFFMLFFTLDLAFLCLGISYLYLEPPSSQYAGSANHNLTLAGGVFGILAAFLAWYNALAGLLDNNNSFFLIPVAHFPWSEKGKANRGKPHDPAAIS